jgi:hypothetical protein
MISRERRLRGTRNPITEDIMTSKRFSFWLALLNLRLEMKMCRKIT